MDEFEGVLLLYVMVHVSILVEVANSAKGTKNSLLSKLSLLIRTQSISNSVASQDNHWKASLMEIMFPY